MRAESDSGKSAGAIHSVIKACLGASRMGCLVCPVNIALELVCDENGGWQCVLSSLGTDQSPGESLKLDTGGDLRSVGRNLIEIAAAIVIVIEIAEAKFGIDVPGDIAAEPTIALHGNDGAHVKTADIHLAGQIKSLVQVIATANADVGISPILGETDSPVEVSLQDTGDSLLRGDRDLPR